MCLQMHSFSDSRVKELLKEIARLVPAKRKTTTKKVLKKGISRGSDSKSISPRTGAKAKQRSVLGLVLLSLFNVITGP